MVTRTLQNCFVAPLLLITVELLNYILSEVIEENEEFILDLNRKQLEAGIRADGSKIAPPYTKFTKKLKSGEGRPFDRVTLFDTGSFYDKMFVDVFAKSFIIGDTDPKTQELRDKYNPSILGLTTDNKLVLMEHLKPQFFKRLRTSIGL